jgi:uncharacterized protein (TIGR00730 family)
MKTVCVFCGSSVGAKAEYREAAVLLGKTIAGRGLRLVYGGGDVGLMGLVAHAAIDAGGDVVGVIPEMLMRKEVGIVDGVDLRIVNTMHERKAMMGELSDCFIALPGGFGTLEEFFEVVTWAQLGIHSKPCALLNVAGYYDPLIAMLDNGMEMGMLKPKHRDMVLVANDVAEALDQMQSYIAPQVSKWLDSSET